MREKDLEAIREPFKEGEFAGDATRLLLSRLGWPTDVVYDLYDELFGDLSEDVHGFGWWEDHLDTRERVLISDYLVGLASELPDSLLQGWIHLSSWRGLREAEDKGRRWRLGNGRWHVKPPDCLADTVPHAEQAVHFAGFFRAVGTVLDLLGALTVGVGGLDTKLRRADWGRARGMLEQDSYQIVADALRLKEAVDQSGPPDWDVWAVDMRNTLVHRPRRTTWIHLRTPGRSGPRSTIYLTAAPGLSEIESMRLHGSAEGALLHEDADQTLAGIYTSVWSFTEIVVPRLVDLWRGRRAGSVEITQPLGQWETELPTDPSFRGYANDSRPMMRGAKEIMMNPAQGHRLRAAALFEGQRHRWEL